MLPLLAALPPPPFLPCPITAGWELIHRATLPRRAGKKPQGGFSAAAAMKGGQELWLLSDTPEGQVSRWSGLDRFGQQPLHPLPAIPLRGGPDHPLPAIIDGEGMVVRGAGVWVASEGRRTPKRQAQLLRFDAASGRLTLSLPLPDDWQPAPARGLPSNGGPESLALLQVEDQPDVLLLAAELPLLQDRPDRVRLLALRLPLPRPAPSSPLSWTPLTPLRLPGPGWGLTDLLVVPAAASASTGPAAGRGPSLLALLRRFEAPDQWQARLALYPIPAPLPPAAAGPPRSAPIPPQASWDLLRLSLLPPDNWEAIINGPPLPDGRPSFLLASDDNFNPFQDNHLAQIAPRRMGSCRSSP